MKNNILFAYTDGDLHGLRVYESITLRKNRGCLTKTNQLVSCVSGNNKKASGYDRDTTT